MKLDRAGEVLKEIMSVRKTIEQVKLVTMEAQMVENSLGIHGDEILYVGDCIYPDVSVSKVHLH